LALFEAIKFDIFKKLLASGFKVQIDDKLLVQAKGGLIEVVSLKYDEGNTI